MPMLRNPRATVARSPGSIPPERGRKLSSIRVAPAAATNTARSIVGTASEAALLALLRSTGWVARTPAKLLITPVTVGRTRRESTALPEGLRTPTVHVMRSLALLAIPWLVVAEIKVTPAGRRFVTVMPDAASEPRFVTVTEKVMFRSTTAGAESTVISNPRSATGPTAVWTVVELLAGFGSNSLAETEMMFVAMPDRVKVASSVTSISPSAGRSPNWQVTIDP